jgi:hypothetical protein
MGIFLLLLNVASAALATSQKLNLPAEIIAQLEAIVVAIAKVHGSTVTGAQLDSLMTEKTWADAVAVTGSTQVLPAGAQLPPTKQVK